MIVYAIYLLLEWSIVQIPDEHFVYCKKEKNALRSTFFTKMSVMKEINAIVFITQKFKLTNCFRRKIEFFFSISSLFDLMHLLKISWTSFHLLCHATDCLPRRQVYIQRHGLGPIWPWKRNGSLSLCHCSSGIPVCRSYAERYQFYHLLNFEIDNECQDDSFCECIFFGCICSFVGMSVFLLSSQFVCIFKIDRDCYAVRNIISYNFSSLHQRDTQVGVIAYSNPYIPSAVNC